MKSFLKVIPPLSYDLHKGQAGRIGVIGGSLEYTGAPFYAAMAAMKVGVDLAHVFCDYNAAIPLKSYSPDLIVHPYIRNDGQKTDSSGTSAAEKITPWLDRLHAVLIGPGLGRDDIMINTARTVIPEVIKRNLPLVVDADGLFALQGHYDLIKGYKNAVLTPNVAELYRMAESLNVNTKGSSTHQLCSTISKLLDGVNIVAKGKSDTICMAENIIECTEEASPRRCGGQGDILSGIITALSAWKHINGSASDTQDCLLAACTITRKASYLCFRKHGRSMTASDMLHRVPEAFETVVAGWTDD